MIDLWDTIDIDEPIYGVDETGRTINPYLTYGPGDGRSWNEFFREVKGKAVSDEVEDDEVEGEVIITQPAEEFDDPCGPLAAYVKLANRNGWTIHTLAHALSVKKGVPFKTGPRAGEPRPDSHTDLQWVFLEKPGNRAVIAYVITNDKVVSAATYRSHNGTRLSDAEMKEVIRG